MYIKLILRNLKRSFDDYIIYFLTLGFAVSIFYIFNAIPFSQSVQSSSQKIRETMPIFMNALSIFISIVLGFLIIYANNFLIKRRSKEIGIYMLLGMKVYKISWMLFFETLILGILALITGLFLGIFISQGMFFIIAKIFQQDLNLIRFFISIQALWKTIFFFILIFIVVAMFSSWKITRIRIINLLQANKRSEEIRSLGIKASIFIFLISLICFGISYSFALDRNFQFTDIKRVSTVLILGSIGTYLFYFSAFRLLLLLLMKNKKIYYKKINIFSLRQVTNKINTNIIMIATISIMLLITVCAFASGFALNDYANNTLKLISPNDFEFTIDAKTDPAPIFDFIKAEGYNTYTISETEVYTSNLVISDTIQKQGIERIAKESPNAYKNFLNVNLAVIKLSQYNKLRVQNGLKPISLMSGTAALHVLEPELDGYVSDFVNAGGVLKLGNSSMRIEKGDVFKENFVSELLIGELEFAVVNDEDLLGAIPSYKGVIINLNKKYEEAAAKKIAVQIEKNKKIDGYVSIRFEKLQELYGVAALAIFTGLYIGITFLIMSTTLLAIQLLTDAADHKPRYETLRKIGTDEKMIDKSILIQIGAYFFAPMTMAVINSAIALKTISNYISSIGNFSILSMIIFTAIIFTIFYGLYFSACHFQFKNVIKTK